jgi:hypothetical protein
VFNCAIDEPSGGLQSGVWVGRNHHGVFLWSGTKVIQEAPSANLAKASLRKQSLNLNAGSGGQLDWPRRKDFGVGVYLWRKSIHPFTKAFMRVDLGVRHEN